MESRDPMSAIARNLKSIQTCSRHAPSQAFFRAVAGLDVHKADVKRYYDFVDGQSVRLLLVAQDTSCLSLSSLVLSLTTKLYLYL
jgi:hypothetical protein